MLKFILSASKFKNFIFDRYIHRVVTTINGIKIKFHLNDLQNWFNLWGININAHISLLKFGPTK